MSEEQTKGGSQVTELGTIDREVALDFGDSVTSQIAEAISKQRSTQDSIKTHFN